MRATRSHKRSSGSRRNHYEPLITALLAADQRSRADRVFHQLTRIAGRVEKAASLNSHPPSADWLIVGSSASSERIVRRVQIRPVGIGESYLGHIVRPAPTPEEADA